MKESAMIDTEEITYIIKYFCLFMQNNVYIEKEGISNVKKFLLTISTKHLDLRIYKAKRIII